MQFILCNLNWQIINSRNGPDFKLTYEPKPKDEHIPIQMNELSQNLIAY